MKPSLLFSMLLVLISFANAQVQTDFNNPSPIKSRGKFMKDFRAKSPYVIPARDIKALFEKEALESNSGEAKPFRIAEAIAVDIDVVREAVWIEEEGNAYGKFTIVAAGAKSISANFDQFHLPPGTEFYVYSENGEMITGPVSDDENNENSFWGSWVYKGGWLTVDLKTPLANKAALKLHISSVGYGYKDLYVADFGGSASCNVNVLCPLGNGWENERNSVALILNGSSTAICSGALINNTCNLNIPYFLTANHCFDGNTTNWKFTFQAWSGICSPSQNAVGTTFNGSTLRARNAGSDFCLLELAQMPTASSNITLAGWSRNNVASPSGASIGHPRADIMKIALYNTTITQTTFLSSQDWNVTWANGTVEPGSSGGPLFNNDRRIIGQVHGGNPGDICTTNDHAFFGRFDVSWTGGGTSATRLSDWLDPANTGATTTDTRGVIPIGGSFMCTSTATYALQNQPSGSTVTWTSSNPAAISINSSTGFATRINNFKGQVTLTASVSGGACAPVNVAKLVTAGSPTPIVTAQKTSGVGEPTEYRFTATLFPGNTYNWYVNNVLQQSGPFNTFDYYFPCNVSKTIKCTLSNECGVSPFSNSVTKTGGCDRSFAFAYTVWPNPSSNMIEVSSLSNDSGAEEEASLFFNEIIISDFQGVARIQKKLGEAQKTNIDLSSLGNGVYIIEIVSSGNRERQRLLINR